MAEFPASIQCDLKSKEEGRNAECCKYARELLQEKTVGCPNFPSLPSRTRSFPMSSSTPEIFRVDTATYGQYCNNLYYLYSISHCFRYSKYEENRTSINFLLHLSASVLMHGSWVKVAQKSTLQSTQSHCMSHCMSLHVKPKG